jgi:hypothetical protein
MKAIITLLALTFSMTILAQTENVWIGGTIGHESDWNTARNWSEGFVPDEDSYVIINLHNSGHNSQPVITGDAVAASVMVYSGAQLTIANTAQLVINGEEVYSEGISLYGGQLVNEGALYIQHVESQASMLDLSTYSGNGLVVLDNTEMNNTMTGATMASNTK